MLGSKESNLVSETGVGIKFKPFFEKREKAWGKNERRLKVTK